MVFILCWKTHRSSSENKMMLLLSAISSSVRIYRFLFPKTAAVSYSPPPLSQLMQAVVLGNLEACVANSVVQQSGRFTRLKMPLICIMGKGRCGCFLFFFWSLTPAPKVSAGSHSVRFGAFFFFCFNLFLVDALLRSHLVFHSLCHR